MHPAFPENKGNNRHLQFTYIVTMATPFMKLCISLSRFAEITSDESGNGRELC